MGGFWSAYWHQGRIYGSEIARGLDVFALTPSEHLSANEIAAASVRDDDDVFNPQKQTRVRWPDEPVVARAYLDQLERSETLAADYIEELDTLLAEAQQRLDGDRSDRRVGDQLTRLAAELDERSSEHEGPTRRRLAELAGTLTGIAERL